MYLIKWPASVYSWVDGSTLDGIKNGENGIKRALKINKSDELISTEPCLYRVLQEKKSGIHSDELQESSVGVLSVLGTGTKD